MIKLNFKKKYFIFIKLIILNFVLLSPFIKPKVIYSLEEKNNLSAEYLKKTSDKSFYILGPGDLLKIIVKKEAPELNGSFLIDGQGYISLPRLKKVYVSGLTIFELNRLLTQEYIKYVKEPDLNIEMVRYRPIKILLTGEVAEPGLHVLPGSTVVGALEENFNGSKGENEILISYFPSLFDAIRTSEGITINADISNIELTRKNNLSNGGGRLKTKANLISFLELKDNNQNIRIMDGDTIHIPRSNNPSILTIKKAIQTNLNPKFINVFINGRVESPGTIKVNKASVLNDAIEVAGGTKIIKGPIRYLTFNNDGSIDKRNFRYKKSASRGSYENPYLSNGDIIFVGKGAFGSSAEVINEITKPLQGIASAITLFEFLND